MQILLENKIFRNCLFLVFSLWAMNLYSTKFKGIFSLKNVWQIIAFNYSLDQK
jgi:hypothetical protein